LLRSILQSHYFSRWFVLTGSRRLGLNLLITFLSLGLVAVFGYIDRLTGTEISFSIFYLLPVALAFWQGGLWSGIATATGGTAAWLIADLAASRQYTYPVVPYWNALMRGLIFFSVGMLLWRLKRALDRETHLATRDALTGIGNWRHFEAVAGRELGRARRTGNPLSVAYIDLDDFKMVNDRLGHPAGDALLVSLASILQDSVRTFDCVARLGGDEFIVLMPETEQKGARIVVERIRKRVDESIRRNHGGSTLSVGLATFVNPPASIGELIKTADDLMYSAKKRGKNSVAMRVVRRKPR
jgi:diguanylate cyclase (GGDEF)-like protein